jgi:hypothetical protein
MSKTKKSDPKLDALSAAVQKAKRESDRVGNLGEYNRYLAAVDARADYLAHRVQAAPQGT